MTVPSQKPFFKERDVFVSGTEGYRLFRIPGLVVSPAATLLAFCEARKGAKLSDGQDIALRRSFDNGETWSPIDIIANGGILSSLSPVVDSMTGTIWLLHVGMQLYSSDDRDIYLMKSTDDGETWTSPRGIGQHVTEPD